MQRSEDKEIWNGMCWNPMVDPLRLGTMKKTMVPRLDGIQGTNPGNSTEGREIGRVYADSFGHGQDLRIYFNTKSWKSLKWQVCAKYHGWLKIAVSRQDRVSIVEGYTGTQKGLCCMDQGSEQATMVSWIKAIEMKRQLGGLSKRFPLISRPYG